MRTSDALWRLVEVVIPAFLVLASVVLLASAVGAMILGAERGVQWELFLDGVACWATGIAWGWLVNDRTSWLRRAW